MAIFFELTSDAFEDHFNDALATAHFRQREGTENARRPLRGLEIKSDTYAILKVVSASGNDLLLFDSGKKGGKTDSYTNFILQSVTEARMEKHQIVDTFGEPYLFLFGEHPRFLDITAILVDSNDFNWYGEWWENYNTILRGTKSVEMNARTYLFYDDNVVEGYMLQAQTNKTSDTPLMATLTFRLFLTSYSNVTMVGLDDRFPIRQGVELPNLRLSPLPGGSTSDPTSLTGALRGFAGGAGGVRDQLGVVGGIASAAGFSPLANSLNNASGAVGAFSDYTSQVANTVGVIGGVIDGVGDLLSGGQKNPLSRLPNVARSVPLRGLFADNLDEYPGPFPFAPDAPTDGKKGSGFLANAESLAMKTIVAVKSVGALVSNTPVFLQKLGVIDIEGNPPGQGTTSTTEQVAAANAASLAAALSAPPSTALSAARAKKAQPKPEKTPFAMTSSPGNFQKPTKVFL